MPASGADDMASADIAAGSLRARSFVAVALVVGFYALALSVAGILIYVPLVAAERERQSPLVILWLAAGVVLWSVFPRRRRFEPPGALLSRAKEPGLFALVDEVARAADQPRPAEVYIVREMNAWVASRGGVMGVGGRRVLSIGLPLLERLTVLQLKSVLAHEYGHYRGGDVRLLPLIYQTRAAIGRTVTTLAESGATLVHFVHLPFLWYGQFFLRFTRALSRAQELRADALAVRIAGRDAATGALNVLHREGVLFEAYWRGLVVPVLRAGYRPPLVRGFDLFLSNGTAANRLGEVTAESSSQREADPYDTHPSFAERLAHIQALPETEEAQVASDDRLAMSVVAEARSMESDLLSAIAPDPDAALRLREVEWDRAMPAVWPDVWRTRARNASSALGAMTAATAPATRSGLESLGRRILGPATRYSPALAAHTAGRIIAGAVACVLIQEGWALELLPGAPAVFRKAGVDLRPFEVMQAIARGDASSERWRQVHEAAQISDRPLVDGHMSTPSNNP